MTKSCSIARVGAAGVHNDGFSGLEPFLARLMLVEHRHSRLYVGFYAQCLRAIKYVLLPESAPLDAGVLHQPQVC